MCPAAPVTATLMGVFMAQLAINIPLSKANTAISRHIRAGHLSPPPRGSRFAQMTGTRLEIDSGRDVSDEIGQDHQPF